MRVDPRATELLGEGLHRLRLQYGVPDGFPDDVLAAAEAAAARRIVPAPGRRDARETPFVTLDPASSTDLDQAFAIRREGDDLVLDYAIADIGFFVERGGALEAAAWNRGSTFYLPGDRVPLYPPVLCEGVASLLPDGDRPAIVLTVVVATDGSAALRSADRAVVRSRAKLAYESVNSDTVPLLAEFAARITSAEDARGAARIEFPEQTVVVDANMPGGLSLVADNRLASEDENATLSLAANLAVADRMATSHVGLFRVMADPDAHAIGVLRMTARVLGVSWPAGVKLRDIYHTLDATDPKHGAFLRLAHRLGGRATYAVYDPVVRPWHSAVAATYAHATAPLRRLADRYVLDLAVLLCAGGVPTADGLVLLARLPDVMERAESTTSHVENGVIDLVEAVTLRNRVGESFDATVTDNDRRSLKIQLDTPPVRAAVGGASIREPGDGIRVELVDVDVDSRKVTFTVVP